MKGKLMESRNHRITIGLRTFLLLSAAIFAAGCSTDSGAKKSVANAPSEGEYLSAADARKDPDRIVCRRHKPTGSRISEKICMTARQWQQAADDSERFLDRAQRAPQAGTDQ
jgi:hypothetical protein